MKAASPRTPHREQDVHRERDELSATDCNGRSNGQPNSADVGLIPMNAGTSQVPGVTVGSSTSFIIDATRIRSDSTRSDLQLNFLQSTQRDKGGTNAVKPSEGDIKNMLQVLVELSQLQASPKELDRQQAGRFLETLQDAERDVLARIDVSEVEKAKVHQKYGGLTGQLYCHFWASKCNPDQLMFIMFIDGLLSN
ncbi:uncharacterized protein BDZ99DRAFT_573315 [Mytilinidion resinicola]|uniref:Uncharacterized protein n=1 Tax=Mytilinidion resinicola TaxID=574789 RepID=A0A6A6YHM5_9PEZI|nr:uncharacterized protein BDZ99DRAFT_573315 [Mytilinidion resinicola]KAF2807505.1 hypothetical protein BDZ99DRAFT_573315 [Mytilinidion resinicola]